MAGILFSVPVFTQVGLGFNAIESGVTMLPMSLSLLVAAFVATRLSARGVAASRLIRVGFLMLGVGCIVLAIRLVVTATKLSLAPSLVFVGLGLGLVLAIIMDFVQSAAPSEQASEVAGFSRSVGYLGSSLGTALSGAVLIGVLIATGSTLIQQSEDLSNGQKRQVVDALERSTQAVSDAQLEAVLKVEPPEDEQEIVRIYAQARNRGLQAAAAVLGVVSLLAFLLAFRLKAPAQGDGG
jgi:Major Facilitator Superfamily